jgi:hypothetical protein
MSLDQQAQTALQPLSLARQRTNSSCVPKAKLRADEFLSIFDQKSVFGFFVL